MSDVDDETQRRRLERLFATHRRAVLGYAVRRTDDAADAADAVAETFLIAWRRRAELPRGEAERAWLLGVTRRVLANQRRGARRRSGLAERLARELTVALPVAPDAGGQRQLVRDALARLSPEDREVLLLSGWEGLAPAEIAIVLGVRGVTARSRLLRARRRLRAHLHALGWHADAPAPTPAAPAPTQTLELAKEHTR